MSTFLTFENRRSAGTRARRPAALNISLSPSPTGRAAITLLSAFVFCVGCGSSGSGTASSNAPQTVLAAIPEHGRSPEPQADITFVGRLDESNALIAVVSDGVEAAAYICDGAEISEWFSGSAAGTGLHLEGERGGTVDGEIKGDALEGGVVYADTDYPFTAEIAVEGESGLYRSTTQVHGEENVSGWIFFDGEWRGADEAGGKRIVNTVSASGVDDATGTGTGLGEPPPVPQFLCGEAWCNHERNRCFISFMTEQMKELKGKQLLQATQMRARAREKLAKIGEALGDNGCTDDGSSCADTGYGSVSDTPSCG